MTKRERVLIGEIINKWPEVDTEDAQKWIHTLNTHFDDISPFCFNEKYGGKRFKKRLKTCVEIS